MVIFIIRLFCLSMVIFQLTACNGGWITTVGPDYQKPTLPITSSWQAPLPVEQDLPIAHQGKQTELSNWWDGFQDTTLKQLLEAAQTQSSTVANARSRIVQARANLVDSDAALLPNLDASLLSKRSSASFGGTPFVWNQYQAGLQSNWELDLFGGLTRQQEAAQSQLDSRQAAWHDARVAVAIEVANSYLAYRYCEIQVAIAETDSHSRQTTAKLTEIATQSGFRNLADSALAHASVADGKRTVQQYQAQCQRAIKSLVALSGLEEANVKQLLNSIPEKVRHLPTPPPFQLDAIPAQVLLQRPDIASAERDMAEANANIGVEQAKRYPKLSLSGTITPTLQNINGGALLLAQTWSFGPTISLPLFDAGKRAAGVDKAQAEYDYAVSNFRNKVRTAVKEVEEALVRLESVKQRLPQAQIAYNDYQTRVNATKSLYSSGLGNLLDLETAQRSLLSAELVVKELQQEQVSAWIALYRAVGGSWETQAQTTTTDLSHTNLQQTAPSLSSTVPTSDFSGEIDESKKLH